MACVFGIPKMRSNDASYSHMGSGDSVVMSRTGRVLNFSHRHLFVLADAFKGKHPEATTDAVFELDVSCNFIPAVDCRELTPFLALFRNSSTGCITRRSSEI